MTFDVTVHIGDASHHTPSLCAKFEVRRSPLRNVCRIFRVSVNRLRTVIFDLSASVWGHGSLVSCLHSCQFAACYALPFSTERQAQDRQTDRRRPSTLHAPPDGGGAHNQPSCQCHGWLIANVSLRKEGAGRGITELPVPNFP